MPPLPGFSDNPLHTRDDVVRATEAILRPLIKYFSPGKARIRLPQASGTHFDETAAQLEGFARPLWVVAPLLMSGEPFDRDVVKPWIEGLEAGTDPEHPEYWGPIGDCDQRMVEAEMISFALLASPRECLWDALSSNTQRNLTKWLLTINGRAIHTSNWVWFRVFANLALLKVCGVDTPDVRQSIDSDLAALDTLYMTDGWSGDGRWRTPDIDEEEWQIYLETGRANTSPRSRNACYYSGSFAIQFSQLLYVRFAGDMDPARAERYRQQARDFGAGFWRYFDAQGAAIPFGRSLTYRFACGGFFAALAVAGVPDMPAPLDKPGAVKGFLLRHLRWWARHSHDIFHPDGTLSLGWTYPNMYLTEDYNSPQSPYWALKSLLVVALSSQHPFWTDLETPYPSVPPSSSIKLLPGPRQILCNRPEGNHHFLLSPAQFIAVPFKGVAAKYSKFAYSSAFGFSVPNGAMGLGQVAPDSVLALSRDGTETWPVKHRCAEPRFGSATVSGSRPEELPSATVLWYPWADRGVEVRTTLVPPCARWPDWHVRVHCVRATRDVGRLFTAEGGFAVDGRRDKDGLVLPVLQQHAPRSEAVAGTEEGIILSESSMLVMSASGASGIATERLAPEQGRTTVTALKPEPNTNLMVQRSLIPTVEHDVPNLSAGSDLVLVTKVFAVASESVSGRALQGKSLKDRWLDQPVLQLGGQPGSPTGDYISFTTS